LTSGNSPATQLRPWVNGVWALSAWVSPSGRRDAAGQACDSRWRLIAASPAMGSETVVEERERKQNDFPQEFQVRGLSAIRRRTVRQLLKRIIRTPQCEAYGLSI